MSNNKHQEASELHLCTTKQVNALCTQVVFLKGLRPNGPPPWLWAAHTSAMWNHGNPLASQSGGACGVIEVLPFYGFGRNGSGLPVIEFGQFITKDLMPCLFVLGDKDAKERQLISLLLEIHIGK